MANRTVKDANTVHGTNPQYLVEKIVRSRIYDSKYWKEHCFALTSEILVDRAMELRYVGGSFGANIKVTPFMCLLLKMLQIQPDKDVIVEFIKQQDFKYVRCLGAIYLRLTFSSLECYKYLEPLLVDYRKIRTINANGDFILTYVDEFIDQLLTEDKVCSIVLPRLTKRIALEDLNLLQPKVSALEEDLEMEEDEDVSSDEETNQQTTNGVNVGRRGGRDASRSRSKSPQPKRRRSRSHSKERRNRTNNRSRSKSRSADKEKKKKSSSKSDKKEKDKKSSSNKNSKDSSRRDDNQESSSGRSKKDRKGQESDEEEYRRDSLSISETNKLRASLGLPPLVE